jgi:predicted ArsR family transcriptional regulator
MEQPPLADRVAAVSVLDDPVRRALLGLVSRSDTPVSRDQAARALGLTRRTAAFHLDRLAQQGLLTVQFQRLTGRTGPGSGRPSKLYGRGAGEVAVTVPERRYELAGELLAAAVEVSASTGEPARDALMRLAGDAGRAIGAAASTFQAALEDTGYEPSPDGRGGILLTNCPFHRLARRHTDLVCHANLELLHGAAEAAGDQQHTILLDPAAGRCCVRAIPARHTRTSIDQPGP